jgi:hypothetical protein
VLKGGQGAPDLLCGGAPVGRAHGGEGGPRRGVPAPAPKSDVVVRAGTGDLPVRRRRRSSYAAPPSLLSMRGSHTRRQP